MTASSHPTIDAFPGPDQNLTPSLTSHTVLSFHTYSAGSPVTLFHLLNTKRRSRRSGSRPALPIASRKNLIQYP
jgi:hypothetical protein